MSENKKILRASKVGFPCMRNLWYSAHGYKGNFNNNNRWILETGKCLEPMIVYRLMCEDWDVEYNEGSQEAPIEYKIPVLDGELAGHPDCFMKKHKQLILADIKTMNARSFTKWKREGSLKTKPGYVDQLHIYAAGALAEGRNLDKLAIVGFNKNDSDMHIDIFDFDPERFENIKQRAEKIFASAEPPTEGCHTEAWSCQYCEFFEKCELAQKDTKVGDNIMETNDTDIVNAVELLKEARDLKRSGEELEKEAKKVLDEKVRKQGMKSVFAKGLTLLLQERASQRFDSKAFSAAYPELAKEFTKSTSSLYYVFSGSEE